MPSQTPTSFYDLNTLPYMQYYNTDPMSFGQSSNVYGFTRNTNFPRTPSMSYKPDASLRDDYKRGALEYLPSQSDVLPKTFNVQDGHEAVNNVAPTFTTGDPKRDAILQQQAQQVNQHLSTIASAKDPDAVAQSIMSQPDYAKGSLGGALMGIGLAAMSGRKADEIFQAGMQGSDYFAGEERKAQMSDYLKQNTKDLLDAGYTPNSISAAIANGDNSLLQMKQLSPDERRKQALEDEARSNKEWDRRNTISQQNALQLKQTESADAEAREARATAKAEANEKQKQAQLNSRYWVDPETNRPLMTNTEYGKYNANFKQHTALGVKTSAFDQANTNLQDARNFKNNNDDISSRASYQQALEQYVKGVMGSGQRSLDDKQLEALGVDPSWIANKSGKFALAAGFSPTDDNIQYIQAAINTDSKASDIEANRLMKGEIDRLVNTRGLSVPEATRIANSYASTTLGSKTYDPYGVFGEPTGVDVNQGVLNRNESSKTETPRQGSDADAEARRLAGGS